MPRSEVSRRGALGLKAGEWVVVRSQDEILATLDAHACLDGLPFQPEMFALCGARLRVYMAAHKTCDSSIHRTGGRRMYDTVHLEGGRCDGSAHAGCQADCVFFWKEAWLKRADDSPAPTLLASGAGCTAQRVQAAAKIDDDPANPTWVCQTTVIYEASDPLEWWDVRQYLADVTSGNHSLWHMVKLISRAGYAKLLNIGVGYGILLKFYNSWQKLRGGAPFPTIEGRIRKGQPTPNEILDLAPGEWVEVKSGEEIAATITLAGFNRGMRYDPEMLKYSGNRYRVQQRVDQLIDEKSGKMVRMKSPCIQLENVYCRAEFTPDRLGCPRASNTYWREIWLKRVADSQSDRLEQL
ncbi:MAG: hypothetical protein IPG25_03295 [Proteobacteria bacterium]|nr:hypothetical protein [Pseudomonadota bacterium]